MEVLKFYRGNETFTVKQVKVSEDLNACKLMYIVRFSKNKPCHDSMPHSGDFVMFATRERLVEYLGIIHGIKLLINNKERFELELTRELEKEGVKNVAAVMDRIFNIIDGGCDLIKNRYFPAIVSAAHILGFVADSANLREVFKVTHRYSRGDIVGNYKICTAVADDGDPCYYAFELGVENAIRIVTENWVNKISEE